VITERGKNCNAAMLHGCTPKDQPKREVLEDSMTLFLTREVIAINHRLNPELSTALCLPMTRVVSINAWHRFMQVRLAVPTKPAKFHFKELLETAKLARNISTAAARRCRAAIAASVSATK
jgi:hypothetical protein